MCIRDRSIPIVFRSRRGGIVRAGAARLADWQHPAVVASANLVALRKGRRHPQAGMVVVMERDEMLIAVSAAKRFLLELELLVITKRPLFHAAEDRDAILIFDWTFLAFQVAGAVIEPAGDERERRRADGFVNLADGRFHVRTVYN